MEKKILEWLNKTGYPLEMWAESVLTDNMFRTTSSFLYQDQETEIFRELDLQSRLTLASKDESIILDINLLIECKKSDKPFILLSNKIERNNSISIGNYYGIDDPSAIIAINNPDASFQLSGINGTGFKLIQGFVNGDEIPHRAINSLIKSFNDYLNKEKEYLDYFIDENINSITFPILLLDSPFYMLKIGKKKEINLKRITTGIIYSISHLDRHYPSEFPIIITTKDSFEELLKQLTEFANKNLDFLIKKPNQNIRNYKNIELEIKKK